MNDASLEKAENATSVNTAYIEPSEDETNDDAFDPNYDGEPKTVEMEFVYKAHLDPARQKDPHGSYGDDEQRRQVEIQRARVEGREPDFDNMGPTVGDVVVPKHVAQGSNFHSNNEVPVAFTADVVVGSPAPTDADGNPVENDTPEEVEGANSVSQGQLMASENVNPPDSGDKSTSDTSASSKGGFFSK